MTLTDEVRAFNRFYTREIGLLNRSLPATDLSLPEARVLYELAQAPQGGRTAAEIGRTLDMDKAHLSRIVARFVTRGLAASRISPDHRKHRLLTLTDAGRKVFAGAEAAARVQVDALLEPIDAAGRNRIIEAMRDIRMALKDCAAENADVSLRPLRPGDVGWIIHRQTVLYTQEYGWDWTYEGLASRILGAFVAEFDPTREDG
jgi:DNA-binding MarR family transcriptional regulator